MEEVKVITKIKDLPKSAKEELSNNKGEDEDE